MRSRPSALVLTALLAVSPVLDASARGLPDDRDQARAARRTPVVEVFESSRDAVVSISSTEIVTLRGGSPFDSFFDDFFDTRRRGRARTRKRENMGSGFVIHPDGYIVTNAHVVARTTEQKVVFADGREFDAQIVAADPSRDLAVLKIEADGSLPTLPLGRSDDLMIGETVIAIGNPLGFQHTVTAGVVSAVDRDIDVAQGVSFKDLIQTDASINPGNSGGPLLNALGELIGINTAIRGDAQNMSFAIPVDQLREVLPDLLDVERRYRIETGLVVDSLDGPTVRDVRRGSPAFAAGIRPGDLLTEIDGRPVREGIDFDIALINRKPGDTISLALSRGGESVRSRLRLAARAAPDGDHLAAEKLGIEVYPLSADVREELGLSGSRGLLITEVVRGGPADEAGIERRDVLLTIGRHYVASVEELGQLLEAIDSREQISVRVLRIERGRKVHLEGPLRVR